MDVDEIEIAPTLRTSVAIVGAGIAGAWLGLKLARAGVDTLLIHYSDTDRGGVLGSTVKSVGAINTAPITKPDFKAFMEDVGQGQTHPSVADMLLEHLEEEICEVRALTELKDIKLGVALKNGDSGGFLRQLYSLFTSCGGRMLNAWVTRIVADEEGCQGLQYQQGNKIGKIMAPVLVLASGGYTGLFEGSVKTNNNGTVLGNFLRVGGLATNLEFVFKHGYGKLDLGALTPTEELCGAEIYDGDGVHVNWLERELYEGRGTENHLEAFRYWHRNMDKDFYIDLKFEKLYRKVHALNEAIVALAVDSGRLEQAFKSIMDMCPSAHRQFASEKLRGWIETRTKVDFEMFSELKQHFVETVQGEIFRVRQIAYFSMGGIAHAHCATNFKNVFVSGEAMHDFGAHRVGGLPWGLYLASARVISDHILKLLRDGQVGDGGDFELVERHAKFDPELLQAIRVGLHKYQERDFNARDAEPFIEWIRRTRQTLLEAGDVLDDAVAWLIVAEGIMQASLCRVESRGCFYRSDYPSTLEEMRSHFSYIDYNADTDSINAKLLGVSAIRDWALSRSHCDECHAHEG